MKERDKKSLKLRQRLIGQAGVEYLESGDISDQERIEILLTYTIQRAQTAPIARAILNEFGSAAAALTGDKKRLLMLPGVSTNTAAFFKFIADTAALIDREGEGEAAAPEPAETEETKVEPPAETALRTVAQGAEYCSRLLKGLENECLVQVLMGRDSRVLSAFFAAEGSSTGVGLPMELIAANARLFGASGVVIAHNHPSGDYRPSVEDAEATRKLAAMLLKNGVRLYEHYVVTDGGSYAMLSDSFIKA